MTHPVRITITRCPGQAPFVDCTLSYYNALALAENYPDCEVRITDAPRRSK